MMQLYDYQNDLIDNLSRSWRDGYKRPCIVLPCGGGKSVIASEIAKRTTDNCNRVLLWYTGRNYVSRYITRSAITA